MGATWRGLRKQTNTLLREQSRRMESAMVKERTWSLGELRSVILDNPILAEIAAQSAAKAPFAHRYKTKIAIARFTNESNYGRSLLTDQDLDRLIRAKGVDGTASASGTPADSGMAAASPDESV